MREQEHVEAIYIEGRTTGRWYKWLGGLTVNIYPGPVRAFADLSVIDVFTFDADRGEDVEPEQFIQAVERREACAAGHHQVIRQGTCTSCGEPAEPR